MSESLIKLCDTSSLGEGEQTTVRVAGLGALAVYNVDGEFFVTDDNCTHMQASLGEEGFLDGYVIQCTWHNGKFDVRTGEVLGPPCPKPIRTHPVVVKDGAVFIRTAD